MTASQDITGIRARGALLRRYVGLVLFCAAVPYLGYYTLQQWSALSNAAAHLRPGTLITLVALLLAMLGLKSTYHVIALRRLGTDTEIAPIRIVAAYGASQMVRYLPGKILGVVYEANRLAGEIAVHRIIAANISQGLVTSALTVAVVGVAALWLYFDAWTGSLVALIAVFAALWLGHRFRLIERTLQALARRVPKLRSLPCLPETSNRGAVLASALLLAEWVPYFAFWALLLPVETASVEQAVLLGSSYAAASLVANMAVVMPSGLVIREAIFLWVGLRLSLDAATLVALGLSARVLFTLADATFVPTTAILARLAGARTP